jgi:uncharacterized protein (TIGR02118 family)
MSAAFLVIYEGQPQDPEAFLRYYVEKHVPLVWKFPKIRRIEIGRGVDGGDFFMITRLTFDTIEDLRVAIHSKERERARADMKNFPPFSGIVRRQAVEIIDMPREAV